MEHGDVDGNLEEQVREAWYAVLPTQAGSTEADADEYFLAAGGSSADGLRLVHRLVGLLAGHHDVSEYARARLSRRLLEHVLSRPLAHVLAFVQQLHLERHAPAARQEQTEQTGVQREGQPVVPGHVLALPACDSGRLRGQRCSDGEASGRGGGATSTQQLSLGLLEWWSGGTARGLGGLQRVEAEVAALWGDAESAVLASNTVAHPPPPSPQVSPDSSPPSSPRRARQLQLGELSALHAPADAEKRLHLDAEKPTSMAWQVSQTWRSDLLRSRLLLRPLMERDAIMAYQQLLVPAGRHKARLDYLCACCGWGARENSSISALDSLLSSLCAHSCLCPLLPHPLPAPPPGILGTGCGRCVDGTALVLSYTLPRRQARDPDMALQQACIAAGLLMAMRFMPPRTCARCLCVPSLLIHAWTCACACARSCACMRVCILCVCARVGVWADGDRRIAHAHGSVYRQGQRRASLDLPPARSRRGPRCCQVSSLTH